MLISPVYSPLLAATSTVVGLVTKYLMPLMVNSLPKSFHTNAPAYTDCVPVGTFNTAEEIEAPANTVSLIDKGVCQFTVTSVKL